MCEEVARKNIRKFFYVFFIVTPLIQGCIGSKSMQNQVEDPFERRKIEEQLKGGKDSEYWDKVKDYYKNDAIIIIDDTKQ